MNTLHCQARLAADHYAQAVAASADARVCKAEAKLACEAAKDAIVLSWADAQTEKDYGRNADMRAARLAEDTADPAANRDVERAAIYADERQAAMPVLDSVFGTSCGKTSRTSSNSSPPSLRF